MSHPGKFVSVNLNRSYGQHTHSNHGGRPSRPVASSSGGGGHLPGLYWCCGLSLFPFWKERTILGIWNSCWIMHYTCMLWGLLTSLCCVFTGGLVLAVPGSAVACYACGYRSALRSKYNLPEAPCGDLTTTFILPTYVRYAKSTGRSARERAVAPLSS
ncbi:hypothetical protein EJB05_06227, partial [Eragrostis curvula]